MRALGVPHIYQGQHDKMQAFADIQKACGVDNEATASVGDDLPDLPMLKASGLALTPFDGHPLLQQSADYVTTQRGGFGAVREIADLISAHGTKATALGGGPHVVVSTLL